MENSTVTTTELLTQLRKLNVTLAADDGQIVFNGPKGALTESLRAELSERKAEILEFLKNVAASKVMPIRPGLVPVGREKKLPLSFAQQRLWFLDQLEPGSAVYNVPRALRIKGALDVKALERSFSEIVRRHEALRTTFSIIAGEPVQVIAPPRSFPLHLVHLRQLSEREREEELQRLTLEEAQRPFDLCQGPLFRATLIRLDEDDHALLLTLHHIVSDGWSMGVLYRELSVLYQAFTNGQPSPLRDLPIQYADFAAWQRQWLQGTALETQLSYWKKQLDGVPAVLSLPTDHPRPARQSYKGARQSFVLSLELTQALKALSRKEDVTLYMTLLTAFQVLLHRHTGQDDIVVGSPIANRNRIEIEGLIGFFVNTLVLRTDHSGNPTFRELLHQVKETALEAYEHPDLPFEKLVEELKPERSLSYPPLFQVMFVLQNAPQGAFRLHDLEVTPPVIPGEAAKFDLLLMMSETAKGLSGSWQYSVDLFEAATVARMAGHWQTLLEGIVANPEQRISELPLLSGAEKQLLAEYNDTACDYPSDKCIHELFEEQVKRTPDAVAAQFEKQQLTFGELNARANQLAHYLKKLGVGPEIRVGLCLERSLEMAIGLLAILKAGGAYVPLDPNYPQERLTFMLEDSEARVLITQQKYAEAFSDGHATHVSLDTDRTRVFDGTSGNLAIPLSSDSLAYVIYTSGSTGRPKGVAIEHRNAVAFLSWAHSAFSKEELSGVLASTSICFDLSVFEIFAPLTCGGRIIIAKDALALTTIQNRSKLSLVNTVPSAMNELLRLDAIPPSVHVINLAGEVLHTELVRRIYESTSVRKVYDLYGPSESTTYSTWTCRSADGPQSIGRPIANARVYILDAYRNPVPIGVVGEIYIGGDGVARGYLNQPELTAEKFIYHSFDEGPEQRLYKTGDLGRYLRDGNIEFIGRLDDQVKIRGYRIELGEIETTLRSYPAVRQCAVAVREDTPGDKRLIGYVVMHPEGFTSFDDLRSFLKRKLPDYMIPSAWIRLDQLPLFPNGKLDREKLPTPDQNQFESEKIHEAPRTSVEVAVEKIWCEVLKVDKVSIRDNFFDLGGHSLLATQVVSRVRSYLSIELPLTALFESPTVAELAAIIEKIRVENSDISAVTHTLGEVEEMTEEETENLLGT